MVAMFTNIYSHLSPQSHGNHRFSHTEKTVEKLPVSALMQPPTSSLRLDYNRALSREFYSNGRSSRQPRASKHSAGVIELVQLRHDVEGSVRRKIGNSRDTVDEDHTFPSLARVFPYDMGRKISIGI